jgi:hypothetical protein
MSTTLAARAVLSSCINAIEGIMAVKDGEKEQAVLEVLQPVFKEFKDIRRNLIEARKKY